MLDIRVVSVGTEYQINAGYIARVCKNFGVKDLVFVNPRCKIDGKTALMYSKHAKDLLKNAKVYKSIKDAVKGYLAIGTTDIISKTDSSLYNICNLSEIDRYIRSKRVAIVLGREGDGLTREELAECDLSVYIETSKEYTALNISHALAIILYKLTHTDLKASTRAADDKYIERAVTVFSRRVKKLSYIRNKRAVIDAFRHILKRANPTTKEVNAIALALSDRDIK
ncbi:MAG: RNA methyltransferase [Candidatus Micrarchaeota archaeon]|nr:MAG: RNA methyltransferase [Candidatus Micrarchaeota archaeon]